MTICNSLRLYWYLLVWVNFDRIKEINSLTHQIGSGVCEIEWTEVINLLGETR
jgi:hypothetical protein